MTVTSFFPILLKRDLDAALKEYEELGFVRKHTTENFALKSHVMELNGNCVEIFTSDQKMFDMPDGFYGMRINVRNFEEGVEYFGKKGYKLFSGPIETESARIGILADDEGRKIFLYKHFGSDEQHAF